MSDQNITTLLIKLPLDLKKAFAGLCAGRGVSVSEELRRFMADELVGAVSGMATQDRAREDVPPKVAQPVKKTTRQTKANTDDQPTRCDETNDMFDDMSRVDQSNAVKERIEARKAAKGSQTPKNVTQGKMKLGDVVMNGIQNKDKRKNTKK